MALRKFFDVQKYSIVRLKLMNIESESIRNML